MNRWRLIAALPLAALAAVPATAEDRPEPMAEAVEQLNDAETQERLSRAIQAMTRAILAMPVGPMAEAVREIDPDAPIAAVPPDARVGDLVGDEAEDLPRDMAAQSRAMLRMAGTLSRQMAVLAPVLRDMARDMGAQIEREMRTPR